MSDDMMRARSQLEEKSGNVVKWRWVVPTRGTVPEDSLHVCDNDEEKLIICLALDHSKQWILRSLDPDKYTVTNEMKFLVVDGEPAWKRVNPEAMSLPYGAIHGEFAGRYGKMYVGRHAPTATIGMLVNPNLEDWSFCTHDREQQLIKNELQVLCVE